jgi:hypothetical protein
MRITDLDCPAAADATGHPVALIGPVDGSPLLWLLHWQPGETEPERMCVEWTPAGSMGLQAIARVDDPETIVRVVRRIPA